MTGGADYRKTTALRLRERIGPLTTADACPPSCAWETPPFGKTQAHARTAWSPRSRSGQTHPQSRMHGVARRAGWISAPLTRSARPLFSSCGSSPVSEGPQLERPRTLNVRGRWAKPQLLGAASWHITFSRLPLPHSRPAGSCEKGHRFPDETHTSEVTTSPPRPESKEGSPLVLLQRSLHSELDSFPRQS